MGRYETEMQGLPLTEEEQRAFQQRLLGLLARQVARYTMGESSSLPSETVRALLESLCLTLRADPRNPERIRWLLREPDWDRVYKYGTACLQLKVRQTRNLWQRVCEMLPAAENCSLLDTLKSIGDGWERYDLRYFAGVFPCSIEYPLCIPVSEELQGVDYIAVYLRNLWIENRFLNRFPPERMRRLLENCYADYRKLPVNLFEPAVVNALGLALLQKDILPLEITDVDRLQLTARLEPLPRSRLEQLLSQAAEDLTDRLNFPGQEERRYLRQTAANLCPRLLAALDRGELRYVFCSLAGERKAQF